MASKPKFSDLRDFLSFLDKKGELKNVSYPIDVNLEMTELSSRVLHQKGPALLFENPKNHSRDNNISVLTNLLVQKKE